GVLGAFGGFLCREFPEHDYQLGRRNCQQFLRRHFVLDSKNPLFEHWPKKAARNADFEFKDEKGQTFRTIIPLMGSAKREVELPPWPRVGNEVVDEFMAHAKRRATKLVAKISREEIGGGVLGTVARLGWWRYRRKVLEWFRSRLLRDLVRNDQHKDWMFLQDD